MTSCDLSSLNSFIFIEMGISRILEASVIRMIPPKGHYALYTLDNGFRLPHTKLSPHLLSSTALDFAAIINNFIKIG